VAEYFSTNMLVARRKTVERSSVFGMHMYVNICPAFHQMILAAPAGPLMMGPNTSLEDQLRRHLQPLPSLQNGKWWLGLKK
jgi:hypothetical protein